MMILHDMRVLYTIDADVDLRTHMISHHEGAVAMVEVALKHAAPPTSTRSIRRLRQGALSG